MPTIVTGKQLIFDKLNAANPDLPYLLTDSNVMLGTPVPHSDQAITKNTAVVVTARDGQKYSGSITAYYDRVDLADVVAAGPAGCDCFPWTAETQISDVLNPFNAMFNTNLVLEDIVDGALPGRNAVNGYIDFNLTAATSSHAFQGSVMLSYKPADTALAGTLGTSVTGLASTDLTTNGTSALYNLLNAQNPGLPWPLTANNSSFSGVVTLSGADQTTYGHNSSVVITPMVDSGYTQDPITLYYDRVDLTALFTAKGAATPIVDWGSATMSSALVPLLNAAYGTVLDASDVVDEALPAGATSYTLQAASGSVAYLGSVVVSGAQTLSTMIASQDIGGLTTTDVTT